MSKEKQNENKNKNKKIKETKEKKVNKNKVSKLDKKELKKVKKEDKEKLKKEKKEKRDYVNLKKKAKIIAIICFSIILIELIIMFVLHLIRESKVSYVDTLYSIENINDDYYLASGSSNFRYSRYNEPFTYEYEDNIIKDKINTVYAEQAKLVKYDNELNVVFEKTFETEYDSIFYDANVVSDGIIAVGSYIYDEKQIPLKIRDGLVVKYDFDGNFLWSKNYQVLGDTEFKRVLPIEDGFIAVGQSIYENSEIGNHDQGGGIIVKYDLDGNIVWKSNWGGNKSGIFEGIVETSDGYIVCGRDAANYGLLVKYDFEGNRIWVKNYANTDNVGMSEIKLKDDKLYIAGAYNTSEEKDEEGNQLYQYDACIFVYDLNGELIDIYDIPGDSDDHFNSLVLLDSKIVAIGYTSSSDIDIKNLNYKENNYEGMLVEFDYEGKVLNTQSYSGKNNEILTEINLAILDTSDKINDTKPYVVVGYSNSKRKLFKGNNKDYYAKTLKYDEKLELLIEK